MGHAEAKRPVEVERERGAAPPDRIDGPAQVVQGVPNEALEEVLRSSPLFGPLPSSALSVLARQFQMDKRFGSKPVVRMSDMTKRFHLVVAGRIRLYRVHPASGRELSLLLFGPGDAFDVSGLLTGTPPIGTAQVMKAGRTVSVPIAEARSWQKIYPEFERALIHYEARQRQALADLATELALETADVRLARTIHRLATDDSKSAKLRPIENLSHEVISSLIGLTREGVTRHLKEFRREGLIEIEQRRIHVVDAAQLEERCQYGPRHR